jgi:hypothetical protein
VFLEVSDPRNTAEWSCFVSHRLSVINQKTEEKSIMKESQNRYSKAAKDWGWREFMTLTSLFDQDAGFLVQDTVVFSAEVLVLKETATMQDLKEPHLTVVKRILRYLQSTLDHGLLLRRACMSDLVVYTNADWAGCPDTRRSTSGYAVFLGDNLVS